MLAVVAASALASCGGGGGGKPLTVSKPATIHLRSPQFAAGGRIPRELTCDGAGRSPALRWSGVPAGTRELALTVDDPDAPGGGFRHWTLWHLGPRLRAIPPGHAPAGSRTSPNDGGKPGWTPPCPPSGTHRYVFTLVALKKPLNDPDGASADRARSDIAKDAIAKGSLTGSYGR